MSQHPLKGKVIGDGRCPSCGSSVQVKVDRSGGVFYFCAAFRDENQRRCNTKHCYGHIDSAKMIAAYQAAKKPTKSKEGETSGPGRKDDGAGDDDRGFLA